MKYCTHCGSELKSEAKFCTSCGQKVATTAVKEKVEIPATKKTKVSVDIKPNALKRINDTIIKNNQSHMVRNAKYVVAFFALIVILAFIDMEVLPIHPAIVMISIFLCISALVVAYMFRQREKKLQTLISGEAVLASWTLNQNEKLAYVNTLHAHETSKNKVMFTVITIFMVVIFGAFILYMDEGKGFMTLMMLGIIGFVALFAFGMPGYYKRRNMKGDGQVLVGDKFAYINGFFHNWDFPLSGINKVKIIDQPFYGLYLEYYYTDRTLTNTETLQIPAPRDVDLQTLINRFNH